MIRRPPRSTLFPQHGALPSWPSVPEAERPAYADRLIDREAGLKPELADAIRRELAAALAAPELQDRQSTRLNSSHANISYAVFCLKKKKLRETRVRLPLDRVA